MRKKSCILNGVWGGGGGLNESRLVTPKQYYLQFTFYFWKWCFGKKYTAVRKKSFTLGGTVGRGGGGVNEHSGFATTTEDLASAGAAVVRVARRQGSEQVQECVSGARTDRQSDRRTEHD